jgi:hypothetical protein
MLKSDIPVLVHNDHLSPMLKIAPSGFSFECYFLFPNEPSVRVSLTGRIGRPG